MKTRFFAFAAAALVLAASCEKAQMAAPEAPQACPLKVTASLEKPVSATSKAVITSDFKVNFAVGDKIYVFNKPGTPGYNADAPDQHNDVIFIVKSVDANGVATFEPAEGADFSRFDPESDDYYAVFGGLAKEGPYACMGSEGVVHTVVSTNPNPTMTGDKNINDFFNQVARAKKAADGSINFNFVNVAGLVKFTVPVGCQVGKFIINGTGTSSTAADTYLSCYARVTLNADGTFASIERGNGSKIGGNKAVAAYFTAAKVDYLPGVYYIPVYPDAKFGSVAVYSDGAGKNLIKKVDCPDLSVARGEILDLGVIPGGFTVGTKLNVYGEGVAAIDADHHMTYIPSIDYHADRTVAAHFSDFCSYKNDSGTNPKAEAFNSWKGYDTTTDIWTSYFDYEIFVKLEAGKDVYFADAEKKCYFALDSVFTYKDNAVAANPPSVTVGGKTTMKVSTSPIAFQVPSDGVYRIRFNSSNQEAYLSRIGQTPQNSSFNGLGKVAFRVWPNPKDCPIYVAPAEGVEEQGYLGHGEFRGHIGAADYETVALNDGTTGCGYKFLFGGLDNDQPHGRQYVDEPYVAWDPETTPTAPKYWTIVPVQGGPWNKNHNVGDVNLPHGSWDLPAELVGKAFDVTLCFNDKYGAYCHYFTLSVPE